MGTIGFFHLWELTAIFMQTNVSKFSFVFVHQHGGNAIHLKIIKNSKMENLHTVDKVHNRVSLETAL